ncbi:MAG: MFS transporter [Actinobacteria bacterium]|nr:MFS transporter [Actinomycetota bacterium]
MPQLTKEEQYIYDESPELSVGEQKEWTKKIFKVFPALANRNYQFYFTGQLVSLIGTWLQIVAQGWLVLKLTNSAFLIGLVAAVAMLPTLLFSLFGGVIVDRFPKKKILIFTQISSMILAFSLGFLTVINIITLWEIIVLAFLLGVVNAIDAPARQAFVVEMVGKEDLPSAISLNSGIFNGARVIGPSLAGFLIAVFGVGGAFILNGISYVAVISALLIMKVTSIVHETHPNPFHAIKEGISYSVAHPIVRTLLIFAGVTSIFGWSYTTILPYITEHTFHMEATGLGYLYAASGIGSLVATVVISMFSKKINALVFILGGNTIFALGVILFSFTSNVLFALLFLFLAGFGLILQFSMMNTTIQTLIEDRYRGRVMSIYTIMFLGLAPLGNLEIGFLSEHFGTGFAIRFGAVITFLFGMLVYLYRNRIMKAYEKYKQE